MDGLKLALLGKFQASFGDKALPPFRTSKVQALLIYLVVEAIAADAEHNQTRTSHRREALMELLWPNLELRAAQGNLRQALYQLRKAVPDQQTGDGTPLRFLDSSRLAVSINPSYQFTNDVAEFISHLRKGRLEAAVDLYRGDFLSDFYLTDSNDFEEWAQVHRNRYRQQAINALERVAVASLADGRYEKVLQVAGQQLAIDDLNEGAYRQMMEAQARLGRRQAALASYETLRQKLDEELGVEPSQESERLLARIQNDEIRAVDQEETPLAAPQMPQLEEEEAPLFVGREVELDQLDAARKKAAAGQGELQFIVGGAGRGKTALVTEFAGRALGDNEDLLLLSGQCRGLAGMGEPYLPFRHILSQLTGDVSSSAVLGRQQAHRFWEAIPDTIPLVVEQGGELIDALLPGSELRRRAATIGGAQTGWFRRLNERLERSDRGAPQKEQLFSQITAVLKAVASKRPLLLIIEDLHWLDAASAGLLFHLSFELANSRILLLGTYRPEEVHKGDGHPLARFESELKRQFGDIWLDLSEKDETQGRSFIDAYLDSEANALDSRFRQELFAHTGGHALFTVELLRALQERGDLYRDEGGLWQAQAKVDWQALPVRVEGVIEQRFGRLDPDLQEALSVAAVQGERFTARIAAEIAGLDERDLARRLSREVEKQHRLVAAEGLAWQDGRRLARYRFRHQLFQQYLYGELPEGERIYLHEAVGLKLEALAEDTKPLAAELAWHFDQAGNDEKALSYLLQAGDAARLLYATEEAVAHYKRALAILKEQGDYEEAARILMKLGLTRSNAFDFEAAQKAYDESFALRRQGEPDSKQSELSSEHTLRLADEPHSPGLGPIKPGVAVPDLPPAPHALRIGVQFPDQDITETFYPGLVKLSADLDAAPDAARSWEILDAGATYLFHLRDDVFWSDGRPVTAADFVYGLRKSIDPQQGSPRAEILYGIIGVADFHRGNNGSDRELGFEALDAHTLRIKLEQPIAHFLQVLTMPFTRALPQHIVESHGDKHNIGCGPFLLQARNADSFLLDKYTGYHGQFSGNVEHVELRTGSILDSIKRYEEEELDVINITMLEPEDFIRVVQRWSGEYKVFPWLTTEGLNFNLARQPFDDSRIRRAFVLATDREYLNKAYREGRDAPGTGGFVPPGMPGHVPDIGLPFDPQLARRHLAEAGYPDGRNLPALKAIIAPWHSWLPNLIFPQWQELLGANVSWTIYPSEAFSFDAFFEHVKQEQPHISCLDWSADYADPDYFLRIGLRQNSDWQHEDYRSLINQAMVTMDQGLRLELFRQAEEILVHEAPFLQLLYPHQYFLIKPWVRNYHPRGVTRQWHEVIIEPHDETVEIPVIEPEPQPQHMLRLPCYEGDLGPGFDTLASGAEDYGLLPGLVQLSRDLDVVPDAAQYWEILDNGRRYRFHLRDDVFWSDGRQVTAADFIFAWHRILDPQQGAESASLLYDISGAADYHLRQGSKENVGINALDERTLEIELNHPTAYFIQILCHHVASAVPRHVVERYGPRWADVDHVVTCGPFRVQSLDKESLILRRDPAYHGRFDGNVQCIEYRFYPNFEQQLVDYNAHLLDTLGWVPPSLRESSQFSPKFWDDFKSRPGLRTAAIIFDVNQWPFDDPRVRRAFVLATDRRRFAEEQDYGRGTAATGGLVPPSMPGYVPDIGLPFDPAAARRLLAEAGFPGGKGLPVVHVILQPYNKKEEVERVLKPWQEILGVEIEWQAISYDEFFTHSVQMQPHIQSSAWEADYPDPDSFLRVAVREWTAWHDDAYNVLIEEARTSLDHNRRLELFRRAEEILAQEAPLMPLLYLNDHRFVRPWIKNYRHHLNFKPHWHKVIIEPH